MKKWIFLISISLCIATVSSCKWSRTAKGGAIGTAAGGAIGAAIGKASGNTAAGAIFGAAVGGVAGASIGAYMDKQAAEIRRDLKNAKVERVGEGIKITFESGILFDVDQTALKPAAKQNIQELAGILNKYDDTNILIEGHTDNTGPDSYNMDLSERRAKAVAEFAQTNGVKATRIRTEGYGEAQPVSGNDNEYGKSQNRRVEVAIFANKKLQRAAKRGDI